MIDSSPEPLSTERRLSPDEINALPIGRYEGRLRRVRDPRTAEETAARLSVEKVLGFDTETKPVFVRGQERLPALLQLAGSREVAVFQLAECGLPDALRGLLEAPNVVKAGVAVGRDVAELKLLAPMEPAGFVDLGDAARAAGLHHHGLRGLAALLLQFRVSKSAQRSNWERKDLTESQWRYAATDAWVSLLLYRRMHANGWV